MREFARVTGMPQNVTEDLFAKAPQLLKDRAAEADAERIATTLRAIGAAVTVERDLLASQEAVDGGVQELVAPNHRGPPTEAPGSVPAPAPTPLSAVQRLRRRLRPRLRILVGASLAVILVVALAPFADDILRALDPMPVVPPVPVKPSAVETPTPAAPPKAIDLHGAWRCTDQRTGLSVYWTFEADGTLTFHGDTFKDGPPLASDPDVPTGWQLTGDRLEFTFARKPPIAYTVSELSFSQLHFSDGRNLDIRCRRP